MDGTKCFYLVFFCSFGLAFMLSLEKLRKIDPSSTSTLSDEELTEICNALYECAELAFDVYWKEKNSGSKNPLGLLSSDINKDIV